MTKIRRSISLQTHSLPVGDALTQPLEPRYLRLQPEMPFHYAKTTRGGKTPDYIVNLDGHPMVIEVGGRGKGRSQFKDDAYERKVVLFDGEVGGMRPGVRVPLFCVGFA